MQFFVPCLASGGCRFELNFECVCSVMDSPSDWSAWSLRQLKEECRRLGLDDSGRKKAELAERIQEFYETRESSDEHESEAEPEDDGEEAVGSEEERSLRMKLLESALRRSKAKISELKRRKRHRESSSSSSSEDSDHGDSSSDSESETSGENTRKRRKRKGVKRRRTVRKFSRSTSATRKWRNAAYQHQHTTNSEIAKCLRNARKALKRKDVRQARRDVEKGEQLMEARQEWLVVADYHGYEAANRFAGVGDLAGVMSSPSKRKRLDLALAGSKQPFRASTPGFGLPGRASRAATGGITHAQSNNTRKESVWFERRQHNPEIVCLRCGKKGHIARTCTEDISPTS